MMLLYVTSWIGSDFQSRRPSMPAPHPWETNSEQGVIARRFVFCQTLLQEYENNQLIKTCTECGGYYALCCYHRRFTCHHYSLVFTDGACSNSQHGAVSGIGVATGATPDMQYSIPVTDDIDPLQSRTNQRAELLAALEGVRRSSATPPRHSAVRKHSGKEHKSCIIITTDSEYVVKGITEWFPKWKVCIQRQ